MQTVTKTQTIQEIVNSSIYGTYLLNKDRYNNIMDKISRMETVILETNSIIEKTKIVLSKN